MMITVDTSVVLAVAADEANKPALIEAARGHDLVAPASLTAEIGNALSAMFKRRRITLAEAQAVLTAYRLIPIRLLEIDLDRAVSLSAELNVYAYDAYVLACALNTSTPLLSLDGGQRASAIRAGVLLHPTPLLP